MPPTKKKWMLCCTLSCRECTGWTTTSTTSPTLTKWARAAIGATWSTPRAAPGPTPRQRWSSACKRAPGLRVILPRCTKKSSTSAPQGNGAYPPRRPPRTLHRPLHTRTHRPLPGDGIAPEPPRRDPLTLLRIILRLPPSLRIHLLRRPMLGSGQSKSGPRASATSRRRRRFPPRPCPTSRPHRKPRRRLLPLFRLMFPRSLFLPNPSSNQFIHPDLQLPLVHLPQKVRQSVFPPELHFLHLNVTCRPRMRKTPPSQ
mmetsp:Transcript_15783/g.30250  ORF Transcript_15783/g.30250 Transcript_15783/m.30250 type:complete len:257 (+) Transcript_15783:1542-2312(+)